jgi:hypothetical protein
MSKFKLVLISLAVLAMAITAAAAMKDFGVADQRNVTFYQPVRIGAVLLPAGVYVVKHTMQGEEHIMVFTRKGKPQVEAKLKCTLQPLPYKATQNMAGFRQNEKQEKVLSWLEFSGDKAQHVFE